MNDIFPPRHVQVNVSTPEGRYVAVYEMEDQYVQELTLPLIINGQPAEVEFLFSPPLLCIGRG